VKYFLILLLTVNLWPTGNVELVVNGSDTRCTVTAQGMVEVLPIVFYDFPDPETGDLYAHIWEPRILRDEEVATVADLWPVAVRWWGRAAGTEDRFRQQGGCGSIPPRKTSRVSYNTTPLTECSLVTTAPMELYLWAYYNHPDPEDPGQRWRYRSENFIQEEAGEADVEVRHPVAVQWYYRRCGTLVRSLSNEWVLARTCGEMPEGF
jgi:hypothetical protein